MIDSTNPRILADNIRHLSGASGSQAADISALQAEVEALGTYATTEVNTGMNFKGDPVYRVILEGTTPTTGDLDIPFVYDKILKLEGTMLVYDGVDVFDLIRNITIFAIGKTTIRVHASTTTAYQGIPFTLIIEYTKPAAALTSPSPAPDDTRSIESEIREEVPEAEPVIDEPIEEPVKKTTRKKTTTTE